MKNKRILLLGATGHLGRVVLKMLVENNYQVTAIIRDLSRLKKEKGINLIEGNVVDSATVNKALADIDVIISTLGHGFRTPYPIQSETLKILIPLMEKRKISRFITITGAALKTQEDPPSFILNFTEKLFSLIDPYRILDAKKQQKLLEKSSLDWTVVRTPVHKDGNSTVGKAGYQQPYPWKRVTRKAVAKFMIECIEKDLWIKSSPIFF